MSKWKEVFKNVIPFDDYEVKLINGEENGLIVELKSINRKVILDFGIARAVRILDEGIIFEGAYSDKEVEKFKKSNFKNIIYQAENEEFGNEIKYICGDFLKAFSFRHYIVITINYSIDIITEYTPEITFEEL